MRFIDETRIQVHSGRGGDGCASFRREKFVPFGGPDGGDGGRGGDVVLVATSRRSTLMELRGKTIWKARHGENGRGKQQTGACGESVHIEVPVGTRVFDEDTGEVLVDLTEDGQRFVAAEGGRPGRGNLSFKSSTNRAPRKCTSGQPSVQRSLRLELLLMADAGLLGFPNAGKSTLISRVSAARPKVADYPFTTLVPSLGVVDMGVGGSFVLADIPGLIAGASEGAGLGHRFLRHVSRSRILLHLVSLGPDEDLPPAERYSAIRRELEAYDPNLAQRPEIIVLTKADLVTAQETEAVVADLRRAGAATPGHAPHLVSAITGSGVSDLLSATWELVRNLGES